MVLGHSRTMKHLKTSHKTSTSWKWSFGSPVSLIPAPPSSPLFLPGNLPSLHDEHDLRLFPKIPHPTQCPPPWGVLQPPLLCLPRGSQGQARGFAADPGDSRTSKENVIYTTSLGKRTPHLMQVKTLWGSAAAIFRCH